MGSVREATGTGATGAAHLAMPAPLVPGPLGLAYQPTGLQEDAVVARRLLQAGRANGVTPTPPCFSPSAASEPARSGELAEERVDGAEEALPIPLGEEVDVLQAAHEASIFDVAILFGLLDAEDFVG